MQIQDRSVPHHGRAVDCTYYWPEQECPSPAVIISHGYNGHKADAARMAIRLAERGIAAVCLSFCGGSTRDTSGFGTANMTLYTQRDDILAVLEDLERSGRVSRIFLYGESMGGMTSVLASVVAGDRIAGLGLLYPALCIADNWRERFQRIESIPETVDFWNMTLGRGFFTSIWELQIFDVLPKYTGPVLIMHGEDDAVVPIRYSHKAAELYADAQMFDFPKEGHGFSEAGAQRVCELLERFVGGKRME